MMAPGTIVMATLKDPRERIWGALREVKPEGITVQGIRVETVDEFINQALEVGSKQPEVPSVFYPLRRLDCYQWDQTDADIAIYSARFRERTGITIEEYLNSRARQKSADQ